MKELIGKQIKSIEIDKHGQNYLRFNLGNECLIYEAQGDCCSESWFAEILGVKALIGGRVVNVEEIDMPGPGPNDTRTRQDVDAIYCYKITTNQGITDVIFRNSSNGYYGGWLEVCKYALEDKIFEFIYDDYSV